MFPFYYTEYLAPVKPSWAPRAVFKGIFKKPRRRAAFFPFFARRGRAGPGGRRNGQMQEMNKVIDKLTLFLLYLTSWKEYPAEGIRHKPTRIAERLRLTWRDYDRSALTRLD